MLRPKWLLTALSFALLSFVMALPGLAQDDAQESFVYLLNNMAGELIRVDMDGTVTPVDLGLSPDAFAGLNVVAIAPDGDHAALCANTAGQNAPPQFSARVRDFTANATLWTADIEAAINCSIAGFSADGSLVALALVHRFPMPDAPGDGPTWELRVVDALTGALVASLPGDVALTQQIMPGDDVEFAPPLLPILRQFDGEQVIFTAAPYASHGFALGAFVWGLGEAGIVPAADHWGNLGVDVLAATGEIAYPFLDATRPAAEQLGPAPVFNTVIIEDATGPRTIYTVGADSQISNTVFIEGGARLAVQVSDALSFNSTEPSVTRWIALDRAGNEEILMETISYAEFLPATGGWVSLTTGNAPGQQRDFTLMFGSGTSREVLWTGQAASGGRWQLLWALSDTPDAGAVDWPAFADAG